MKFNSFVSFSKNELYKVNLQQNRYYKTSKNVHESCKEDNLLEALRAYSQPAPDLLKKMIFNKILNC